MADPFSIVTGTLTVADVCLSACGYLRKIIKTSNNVGKEIECLERDISGFGAVFTALGDICETSAEQKQLQAGKRSGPDDPREALWGRAATLVREGQDLVEELQGLLVSVLGDESSPKFQKIDSLQKSIRLLSKNKEFNKIRRRFTDLNLELNTMLVAIDLVSNSIYRSNNFKSLEQLPGKLSQKLQGLGLQLKDQIEALENAEENLEPSIVSARAAVAFTSLNEHYYVQKPDTSIWTGREKYLTKLRNAMLGPQAVLDRTQKRFVVQGISGAGKTQFCCKFAQDYRESFWGIFWVDASNVQNATESWKKIAKIGGKDANEEAGKFWLSNLQSPWLLIIDGADNSEEYIRTQFPSGERGYILITTRNPRLSINATVGYLTLDRLEEDEADELLRKATKHEPWDGSARSSALSIAKHLGYLPLALIHAGRAIFHRLCTLHGYIPFFNRILNDYRQKKYIDVDSDDDDDNGMGVFTSFDIIYSGLEVQAYRNTPQGRVSQDAIELINIFSFLHNNDIQLDILIKAAQNLHRAARTDETKSSENQGSQTPQASLLQRLKDFAIILYLKWKRPVPILPGILRSYKVQDLDESRARKAIDLLVRMSLLSESSESGSFSMHPLVHMWARKRLSTSARALWCGATADILASSIKIPPMVDDPGDDDFYVRILKHVNQVQQFQEEVRHRLWLNCHEANTIRSWFWMSNPLTFDTRDALQAAKYSRVYMTCSLFEDAEKLQRLVLDYIGKKLGSETPLMVPISLALSVTLWHLGRAAEAQELQENALQICKSQLGKAHPQTLKVMDALGETYWQRGWLKESKALHEEAINGMEGNPDLLRDRLKAMIHLGRVHEWYTEHKLAQTLYEKASGELAEAYGEDDFDAMIAKDCLAMTLIQLNEITDAKRAHDLMQDIYKSRRKRLGEEHLYTLWAACNLARTLTVRGSLEGEQELLEQAKAIFRDGLVIITRNLGANHIGTLMGRGFLANAFVAEKKYDQAMSEYKDLAEQQKNLPGARAGTHRDRLITLQSMVDCYEIQDKFQEAVEWCDTIIKELDDMGGHKHPSRQRMVQKRDDISAKMLSANASEDLDNLNGH